MKNIAFALFIIISTFNFSVAASTASTFHATDFLRKVNLPAGTLVSLETAEKVLSDQVTVGQLIKFKVVTNVVVGGKVVIRTGASALGRIKSISEATYNSPTFITVELTSAQAVDGQQVALNGTEQTFKGIYPNEGTLIFPGKSISANVMNDMVIDTK